jgi:protein-tyrosine phosphatase
LEDEVRSLVAEGANLLVSLLTRDETRVLALEAEDKLCRMHGVAYLSFPIDDRAVPTSKAETLRLVQAVTEALMAGQNVVVHCRAGIGRSAVIAACILVYVGWSARESFKIITAARGASVPDTGEQIERVERFASYCQVVLDQPDHPWRRDE